MSTSRREHQKEQNFNYYFYKLEIFINENNRLPNTKDDQKLYSWVVSIKNAYNKNKLDAAYIEKLNTLGFIWNQNEQNWYKLANKYKAVLTTTKAKPNYYEHPELHNWYRYQNRIEVIKKLDKDKKAILKDINTLFKGNISTTVIKNPSYMISAKDVKWRQKLEELKKFRSQNPNRWPSADRENEVEKKLGIWCQFLRSYYKKLLLNDYWIAKLKEINFNFNGRLDFWEIKFNAAKKYLKTFKGKINTQHRSYVWCKNQHKNYNYLNTEQKEKIDTLNFVELTTKKTWEDYYEAIANYILKHKKIPSKYTNTQLAYWLRSQRNKFKKNSLTTSEITKLQQLGIALNTFEKRQEVWDNHYNELVQFRLKNPNKWPSILCKEKEKKLYEWCQVQRQVNANTALGRKELSQYRIDKLNKIGFHWSLIELLDKNWEINYLKLKEFLNNHNTKKIPSLNNYKYSSLYSWLRRQKMMIENNKLAKDKIDKLELLGIL